MAAPRDLRHIHGMKTKHSEDRRGIRYMLKAAVQEARENYVYGMPCLKRIMWRRYKQAFAELTAFDQK